MVFYTVVNRYILSSQVLHAAGPVMMSWRLNIKRCTDHQKMQSAISLILYIRYGARAIRRVDTCTVPVFYGDQSDNSAYSGS